MRGSRAERINISVHTHAPKCRGLKHLLLLRPGAVLAEVHTHAPKCRGLKREALAVSCFATTTFTPMPRNAGD